MDTSAARRNILARIRAAHGRPADASAREHAEAAAYLASHTPGPRPDLPDDLLACFADEARRMASTVEILDRAAEIPAAVARYLREHALGTDAVAWPQFAAFDWGAAGLSVACRPPADADAVGLTGCFCALAETGSLVLLSAADQYAATALLPPTHISVVPASRIVAGQEDAYALMRRELGELPRAVNIVSGPSRTADIEQTVVFGAHGPFRVHVLIVRDA